MHKSDLKVNRLAVWGNSLLNKLPARSRKKRLRRASKIRRQEIQKALRKQMAHDDALGSE